MDFSKLQEIGILQAIDPPIPLLYDDDYCCFRIPVVSADIIFIEKAKISVKTLFPFVHNFVRKTFSREWTPGRQEPLKRWDYIGFRGPGASGPRG